jgi:hypothetical protein
MSRCLRDRTLWLLFEGETKRDYRGHLDACPSCTARYHWLERHMEVLTSVLEETSPPQAVARRPRAIHTRWIQAAALLVTALMVVWTVWWPRKPSPLEFPSEGHYETIWPFLQEVSNALFVPVDLGLADAQERLPDVGDLQAALRGERPCETQASCFALEGASHTVPLLAGGW